jgi:hypothetical protein
MAPTLTVDHRVVDGLRAAAFLRDLKAGIEAEFRDWYGGVALRLPRTRPGP